MQFADFYARQQLLL